MSDMLPFLVAVFGLICVVTGGWGLFSALRSGSGSGTTTTASTDPAAVVNAKVRTRLRMKRIFGVFWFCLGGATFWFSEFQVSWILPSVGLFWMALGLWGVLSSYRPSRQAALEKEIEAAVSHPYARRLQLFTSGFLICLGVAMVHFSGLRVGASPVVLSQPREVNGRLAEVVTPHVETAFNQPGHVGLVVGAIAQEEEILLGFGTTRLGTTQPPDAETVFEIGSISKAFTGILLAQAIENGELELDDRVADLLPEGWRLSEPAGAITLRQCTTHTTGLPRLPSNLLGISGIFRVLFGGDPYHDYSEAQFRDALATVKLESRPGTVSSYSNFAVGLLGFVLASQQGADYETLVKSRICEPLGMNQTVITYSDWHQEHLPAKYRSVVTVWPAAFGLETEEWVFPNHLAATGASRSTGHDMMTFLKANMGRTATPIDAAIQRSHQELFQERNDRALGMNWIRSFDASISQNIIWHNGGTGGFRSYIGFTEDHQFGIFVLSNTAVSVDALAEQILKAVVQTYAPASRKTETEYGYAKVAPFTGIRWENDRPIVEVHNRWAPLVSIDGIAIEQIMDFAQQQFGDKARKRFAEDLVELLAMMGHEPGWEVTLGLESDDGQVEEVQVAMTEENRSRVRE